MRRSRSLLFSGAAILAGFGPAAVAAQAPYRVYVASESEDVVTILGYTPGGALEVEKVIPVGRWPAEIEGPHGVNVDPTGKYWYLSLGHGFPNGTLLRFDAAADTVVGWVELGMFPATVSLTPEGALAFIVNSNFYGDMVPSTVSIVDTEIMMEIQKTETCTMPHGSRMSPDGQRNYTACMMDDQLVEISAASLEVSRRMDMVTGEAIRGHGAHDMAAMGGAAGEPAAKKCSPTWTAPAADGRHLYVACNKGNEIVEVDVRSWKVLRRLPAEGAPYNLALTHDGTRLLATLKGSGNLGVWDIASGERVATVPSLLKVTHGVVEVIDLTTYERVASAEVGKQAGGIALAVAR